MFKQKKAQTGETISWIVATIIIFVILMFFVFGASLLGNTKKILQSKDHVFDSSEEYSYESAFQKSMMSYYIVEDEDFKIRIKEYVENQSYDFNKAYSELRRGLR